MEPTKEQLQVDLRYAQRLCERTARFYRRIQTSLTFLTLLAGSGAIAALSAQLPTSSNGWASPLQFAAASTWRSGRPNASRPTMPTSANMRR